MCLPPAEENRPRRRPPSQPAVLYRRLAAQYPEEKDEAGWDAALERCREEELAELVSRRVRYERDGLRATRLLDRAAARGRMEPSTWQHVPWWAWAAGALILVVLVTTVLVSPTQLYGPLHFVSDRSGKREIYRLTRTADIVQVTHTLSSTKSWAPGVGPGGT